MNALANADEAKKAATKLLEQIQKLPGGESPAAELAIIIFQLGRWLEGRTDAVDKAHALFHEPMEVGDLEQNFEIDFATIHGPEDDDAIGFVKILREHLLMARKQLAKIKSETGAPSAGHDFADEIIGLLRVARGQRDSLEGDERLKQARDRIEELEDLLRSARCIARRNGEGTAWKRFDERLTKVGGIGNITAKTFRILPSDLEEPGGAANQLFEGTDV